MTKPVETPGLIPDDLMSKLQEISAEEATAQLSKNPVLPDRVQRERRRPNWRVVFGHVLGFVVGLGWFLYLGFSARVSDSNLMWGLLFLFGFVAAIVALAVSYTCVEWRKAKSKNLVPRLLVVALIYSAASFLVYELLGLIALIQWVKSDYGG